jgi:oligopeptide transport system ATP-binding protein
MRWVPSRRRAEVHEMRGDEGVVPGGPPILEVRDLTRYFASRGLLRGRTVRAVDGVDLSLRRGETLGIVGESGCGKSTLARLLIHLLPVTSGTISFHGRDITHLRRAELRAIHHRIRMVFQNPYASLNPRMSVRQILAEPLRNSPDRSRVATDGRVSILMDQVGLSAAHLDRYPSEFSGGQRQRIAIARALATNPEVLILDEPVSSLDVSIQAQILALLMELQQTLGLSYIFVAHDLSVVRHISDRVAVMYLGRIVEVGPCDDLFERPAHPYTEALLAAMPVEDPGMRDSKARLVLQGEIPSPANPPSGCRFRTRCRLAVDRCTDDDPANDVRTIGRRTVACHFPLAAD